MPEPTLHVTAMFRARPGQEEALRRVLRALVAPTRREDGCIRYDLLENLAEPGQLTFVEEWRDEAALTAHLATAHIQEARRAYADLVDGDLDLRRYRMLA